ncbi:MAG: succinate dehydrogenase,hydrophobic rane anchor protein [Caulobacter sp.]|jgi:succinate dehydrogenase / fumarate reductase membrane anchor subunit|nr:succinate dehydrogenase,hydrophobic rane anchor protein [Caulobacter sp.]
MALSPGSFRTPRAQVRGLGAAKHGAGHWVSERLGAIALVPLVLWAVYSALRLASIDYASTVRWIHNPLNAVLVVLLLAVGFMHMCSGLRVVIEDYFPNPLGRSALLAINVFVCALGGALAIFSILRVALVGI